MLRLIARFAPIIAGSRPSAGEIALVASSNLLWSGSVSRWNAIRSPPLLSRARTSTSARPERTSALAHSRPLRGLPLTSGPRFNRSMRKLADVDVEPRKDRPLVRARFEHWQSNQCNPLRRDAADAKLVIEPRARCPIEPDVGRRQEHAPLIGDETLRRSDLPKSEPSIRPTCIRSPEAVSSLPSWSTMKRWPGALSRRTSTAARRNKSATKRAKSSLRSRQRQSDLRRARLPSGIPRSATSVH